MESNEGLEGWVTGRTAGAVGALWAWVVTWGAVCPPPLTEHSMLSSPLQFWLMMSYLSQMTEEQTLVMYSGHPLGLFPSSPQAPRLVITNGMVGPGAARHCPALGQQESQVLPTPASPSFPL